MFENVTLEISLKPFKQLDEDSIRRVCAGIFEQWHALLKGRKVISFLFWTSDGSEILDYAGNPEDTFEWCYYLGTANRPLAGDADRPDLSLHQKKRYYRENPPKMTYRILKSIISILKEEGKRAFPDAVITVGETFDIGPEFAFSDFKYNRHTEICTGSKMDHCGMVDATAHLKGDTRHYAAYPEGIPDDTPFGLFLGKQASVFLADMGFDYLWLSNGLGFSDNPWNMEGKIFDGEHFHPERLAKTREEVFEFWKQFRAGCPDYPLETRGTNNSVGIDYATDGVPLYDIYRGGFDITPPPNSPWAALNDNFGLEIMGHMTRICELPGKEFMFRYYIHDPWWVNSPWYDRYDNQPHDIYLPMSISRIDEDGKPQSAGILNILSIDNSYGNMPDCCVNEPLPHLLKAEKNASDEPAPFVWVYPMREYTTSDDAGMLEEMYYGDRYICDCINAGFPLNCVVSTDNFLKQTTEIYRKSILLTPLPVEEDVREKLTSFAENGGKVICYGTQEAKDRAPGGSLFVNIREGADRMLSAAESLGYLIASRKLSEKTKVPTMTLARYKNGLWLAAYNTNTTTETRLKFPLGAPILMGCETELKDGCSTYHFARSEYRECRIFVKQNSGVIGAREATPVNAAIRRRFRITGLQDATVCFFPETYCTDFAMCAANYRGDGTPEYDWNWQVVEDAQYGTYLKAEHVTGDYSFMMPHAKFKETFLKWRDKKEIII